MTADALLEIEDLSVVFDTDDGAVQAVDRSSFSLSDGETLGLVGESGSGKSVTSLAIMGLLPKRARVTGSIRFRGRELLGLSEHELRPLLGERIAMVFQDALAALNPAFTVGNQIAEAITVHHQVSKQEVRVRAIDLLDVVGIPSPQQRVDNYPHELSGGMRQRAMIAMAIANEPDLLIADEPTTALDVTIQAQVLETFERIQNRTSSAILLITHDLGVVAGMADRVLVMYAGRPVELADVEDLFYRPRHPYTAGLLGSLPRLDRRAAGPLTRIKGQPPSLISLPPGCAFGPRCDHFVKERCGNERPSFALVANRHHSSCLRADELGVLSLTADS